MKKYDKEDTKSSESKQVESPKPTPNINKASYEIIEKPGEVIDLTEGNFETARDKQGILFVKFFAPW